MDQSNFRHDGLLLIGHGSARYADAGRILLAHAAVLRTAGWFREVAVGFLAGLPSADDARTAMTVSTVHVVPFFTEDGYFARVAVAGALASADRINGQRLRYCQPVGTHDGIAGLIEARIQRLCADSSRQTVLLVGHGSRRAPGRSLVLHRHARRLREGGRFAGVQAAFLEEPPLVAEILAGLRDGPVVVVGLFAGEGMHAREDLPRIVEAESRYRKPRADITPAARHVTDLGMISEEPGMQAIILDQVAAGLLDEPL